MTNSSKSKDKQRLKDLLECPLCSCAYNISTNLPKVIPCGKTVCEKCTREVISKTNCKFCSNEHNLPKRSSSFTTNKIIVEFLNDFNPQYRIDSINNDDSDEISKSDLSKLKQRSKHRRMSLVLDELETNTKDLDKTIKNSRDFLIQHFNQIENEINNRTDKLMNDLIKERDSLIKELNAHKNTALSFLDEGINENSTLISFNKESKQNYLKLINSVKKMSLLDENELRDLTTMADDLNERLVKAKMFFEDCIKNDLKFIKSSLKLDSSLIGRIEFSKTGFNSARTTNRDGAGDTATQSNKFGHDLNRFRTLNYKIPYNCKNILLSVLPNLTVIKLTEMSLIEDFTYTINFDLMNQSSLINKSSEQIGSYRLKRLQTNLFNNQFILLLTNKFHDSNNCLKLYESTSLKLINTLPIQYNPIQILMSKNHVYTQTSSHQIYKYDYDLKFLNSFGQSTEPNSMFYMPKHYKLLTIQNERIFLLDNDKSKIRIMNELSGKVIKSFSIEQNENQEFIWSYDKSHFIIKIDSDDRVYVLNKKLMKLLIFTSEGLLLNQTKLDDNKIQSIDDFYPFNDSSYTIVDKKNNLIHFF